MVLLQTSDFFFGGFVFSVLCKSRFVGGGGGRGRGQETVVTFFGWENALFHALRGGLRLIALGFSAALLAGGSRGPLFAAFGSFDKIGRSGTLRELLLEETPASGTGGGGCEAGQLCELGVVNLLYQCQLSSRYGER